MNIIQQLEAEQAAKIEAKRTLPEFSAGDTGSDNEKPPTEGWTVAANAGGPAPARK